MAGGISRGKILAIAIAVAGVGTGLLGVYVLKTERPVAGEVIRTLALPDGTIDIRAEQGGDRNFIEYRDAKISWQALIPPYAGVDGTEAISVNQEAIMVRVLRGGNETIFSFARNETSRLGTIVLGPTTPALLTAVKQLGGRVWTFDHMSYQLVADGEANVAIGAFDLHTGKPVWKTPLHISPTTRALSANSAGLFWSDGAMAYALRADKGEAVARKGVLMCTRDQFVVLTHSAHEFEAWDGSWDNVQGAAMDRDGATELCAKGGLPKQQTAL